MNKEGNKSLRSPTETEELAQNAGQTVVAKPETGVANLSASATATGAEITGCFFARCPK